jgi:hypothetical protein
MINNIEIEKYFNLNCNAAKKHNNFLYQKLSLLAWKTGFLINSWGSRVYFIKKIDIIVRNSQYDYCVNFILKNIITINTETARKTAETLINLNALIASNLISVASDAAALIILEASNKAKIVLKNASIKASELIRAANKESSIDTFANKLSIQKNCKFRKIIQNIIFDIRVKNNNKQFFFKYKLIRVKI